MKNKNAQHPQDAQEKAEAVVEAAVKKEEEKEEKKSRKVLNTVINVILIIAIVVAVIATYVSFVSTSGNGVPNIFGLRLLSIQTDSMYPTIDPGDLVLATGVKDPSKLQKKTADYPGDIITYWTIIDGERVLNTHRITGIYDGGTYRYFETKGDRNTIADPITVHESEVVGQYKFRIGGVGKVLDYFQTSTGFLLIIVLPVLLFFIFHLVQFFRVLFEYQNVKMLIKYEQERGRTEDLIESQIKDEAEKEELRKAAMDAERAKIEAELREKIKAEMMAEQSAKSSDSAK